MKLVLGHQQLKVSETHWVSLMVTLDWCSAKTSDLSLILRDSHWFRRIPLNQWIKTQNLSAHPSTLQYTKRRAWLDQPSTSLTYIQPLFWLCQLNFWRWQQRIWSLQPKKWLKYTLPQQRFQLLKPSPSLRVNKSRAKKADQCFFGYTFYPIFIGFTNVLREGKMFPRFSGF